MSKSDGHLEFIGDHEFYVHDDWLYRAEKFRPLVDGKRRGVKVTAGSGIQFALRLAKDDVLAQQAGKLAHSSVT